MDQQPMQQPVAQMSQQQPEQPAPSSHAMRNIILVIVAVLVLLGVGAGSYYLGMVQTQQAYKMPVDQPLPVISRVPTATPTPDPTATWQVFSNATYSYSLKYPQGLVPKETDVYYHYVTFTATGASAPTFVVSAIPDTFVVKDPAAYNYMSADWINSISTMQVGESRALDATSTYTRIADTTVDNVPATAIQIHANGSVQERVNVKAKNFIYMISTYYQTQQQAADSTQFNLFLSTFRFTQ